jgi:hypothetical protein
MNTTVDFPLMLIELAWERAKGMCECRHAVHGHRVPCGRKLRIENRGVQGGDGWEAHAHDREAGPTVENCEILCLRCYKQTRMYTG